MDVLSFTLLLFCLGSIVFQDIREGIIPDGWLVVLIILGVLHEGFSHTDSLLLLGTLGYCLYKAHIFLKGYEGLGFGDVKMMGACGAWIPLSSLPLFLIATGALGILTALLYKKSRFPLGPALAFALGICIFGNTT